MILRVNNDGSVISFPQSVVTQGSMNAQNLQVVAPFSKEVTAEVRYTLPNGAKLGPFMMSAYSFSSENNFNMWSKRLNYGETEFAGIVDFTIIFRNNLGEEEEVLAAVNSTFTVNKGNYPDMDLNVPQDAWETLVTNINKNNIYKYNFIPYDNIPSDISYDEDGYKEEGIYSNYNDPNNVDLYKGTLQVIKTNKPVDGEDDIIYQYEILYSPDNDNPENKMKIFVRSFAYRYEIDLGTGNNVLVVKQTISDWEIFKINIDNVDQLQTELDNLQTQLDNIEYDISSHNALENRDEANAHPIAAITNLQTILSDLYDSIPVYQNRWFTNNPITYNGVEYKEAVATRPDAAAVDLSETVTATNSSTANIVEQFLSTVPAERETDLPEQDTRVYIKAKKNNTQRTMYLFAELYNIDTTGTETLLATSDTTQLSTTAITYGLGVLVPPTTLQVGDRALIKIKSYYEGSGTEEDSVITIQGNTESRFTYNLAVGDISYKAENVTFNEGTIADELTSYSRSVIIRETDWDANNQLIILKHDRGTGGKYAAYILIPSDYQLFLDMEIMIVAEDNDTITIEAKNPDNISLTRLELKGVI